jgi:hypothetical protein
LCLLGRLGGTAGINGQKEVFGFLFIATVAIAVLQSRHDAFPVAAISTPSSGRICALY